MSEATNHARSWGHHRFGPHDPNVRTVSRTHAAREVVFPERNMDARPGMGQVHAMTGAAFPEAEPAVVRSSGVLHEDIGQRGELFFRHVPFVGFLVPDVVAAVTGTVMYAGLQQQAPLDGLVDYAAGMGGYLGPSHRDSLASGGFNPGGGMQYSRIQGVDRWHERSDRVLEPRQRLGDPVAGRGIFQHVVGASPNNRDYAVGTGSWWGKVR